MALRCRFNHNHPPEPLKAATLNKSRPRGGRPYRCPDCSEIAKALAVNANWIIYPDLTAALSAGHGRACRLCFPAYEASLSREKSKRITDVEIIRSHRVTADELATWRRQLLRLLDALDNRLPQGIGLAARIARLRSEGRIPRDTAAQMLLVSEARNAAEYENRTQTAKGAQAVRNAWAAVVEWADSKGLSSGR